MTKAAQPPSISLQELRDAPAESIRFIDARSSLFFAGGHIPHAVSLPRKEFASAFARVEGVQIICLSLLPTIMPRDISAVAPGVAPNVAGTAI